jgi:hypothetical protein
VAKRVYRSTTGLVEPCMHDMIIRLETANGKGELCEHSRENLDERHVKYHPNSCYTSTKGPLDLRKHIDMRHTVSHTRRLSIVSSPCMPIWGTYPVNLNREDNGPHAVYCPYNQSRRAETRRDRAYSEASFVTLVGYCYIFRY